VSDLPYRSENTYEALADRRPVLGFFDHTPAAQAIDTAARLFPLFAPRPKFVDPHPLAHPIHTAWTASRDAAAHGWEMTAAGALLLGLAVAGGLGARRGLT
jgi:hypothetical protein